MTSRDDGGATYIAILEVWTQCSSDYQSAKWTRTMVCKPETTVAEVMEWAAKVNALGSGDLKLVAAELSKPSKGEGS